MQQIINYRLDLFDGAAAGAAAAGGASGGTSAASADTGAGKSGGKQTVVYGKQSETAGGPDAGGQGVGSRRCHVQRGGSTRQRVRRAHGRQV